MEGNAAIIVVGIFAFVIIVVALIYRKSLKASIKGPGGLGLDVEASNESGKAQGGVQMTGVKAGRDIAADDRTGGGVSMNQVEAGQDVQATSEDSGASPPPKP